MELIISLTSNVLDTKGFEYLVTCYSVSALLMMHVVELLKAAKSFTKKNSYNAY